MVKSPSTTSQPARVLQIPGKRGKIPSQVEPKHIETPLLQGKKKKTKKSKDKKDKVVTKGTKDSKDSSDSKDSKDKEMVKDVDIKEASSTVAASAPRPETSRAAAPAARVLQIPGRSFSSEKRRFMSDKVADIRSKPQAPKQKRKGGKGGDTEDTAEFKKTLKDVLNFVVPQMGKFERRQYEEAKVRALGGTLEKRPHEPYSVLQKRWKRQEETRQQRLEEEKNLGVSLSVVKHRTRHGGEVAMNRKEQARIEKKRRKESDILGLGAGARERRGMVMLPKNRVKAYS